jgi:solute carrier family 6 (neurotransmitter transporter, taurine) member 6
MLQGGIFYFQIVDYYAAALSLMYIAFFECIAIVWFYGAGRLASNTKDMTGKYPNWFFRICWLIISPVIILVCANKQYIKECRRRHSLRWTYTGSFIWQV